MMVTESSMKIKGTLDTSNIDRGFARVTSGFEGIKGQGKSFGSDMQRVANTVSSLSKKLVTMGLAGVTAIIGIASRAPAVAPAMAKMSVEFGKLTRSLGEALAPAFEKVVGWLGNLATWVGENKDKIGEISLKFLDWAENLGTKLWPYLEKLGNWAVEHPGLFAGILSGLVLGPTMIKGINAISGLVSTLSGAILSSSLLSGLGFIAAIATSAIAIGEGLGNAFKMGEGVSVPLSDSAKGQIAGASTSELLDLSNRYAERTSNIGYGPESTVQINPTNGRLYSNDDMVNSIINYMQSQIIFSMNQTDRSSQLMSYNKTPWG